MPLFVAALAAAVFASGICCAYAFLASRPRAGRPAPRRTVAWALLLAAVVAAAVGLRVILVPPHHAMYLDEPWYAEAACNLSRRGELALCERGWDGAACVPYAKAPGWPVLIAGWMALAGCDPAAGIVLNRILGVATVLLVALAACCAGANRWQSLFAASIAALVPPHVAWSATGETNVAAAAFLLAGLCGALLYLRSGRICATLLAAAGLGLASAIRPELGAAGLVSAAVLLCAARRRPSALPSAAAIAALCAAGAAMGWQLWQMNTSISGGAFLAPANLAANGLALLRPDALRVHGVVALLGLIGAAVLAARGAAAGWLLLATAAAAALVVVAYDRFHERMLLAALVALLPLSGFALPPWRAASPRAAARAGLAPLGALGVLLAVVLLWRDDLVAAGAPPETQLLETRIAGRVARLAPQPALFVAAHPTVVRAAGATDVMPTRLALQDEARLADTARAGTPVYFVCDMYCEEGFQSGGDDAACRRVFERFATAPILEETLHGRTYGVYRITGPATGESAAAPCPRRAP